MSVDEVVGEAKERTEFFERLARAMNFDMREEADRMHGVICSQEFYSKHWIHFFRRMKIFADSTGRREEYGVFGDYYLNDKKESLIHILKGIPYDADVKHSGMNGMNPRHVETLAENNDVRAMFWRLDDMYEEFQRTQS